MRGAIFLLIMGWSCASAQDRPVIASLTDTAQSSTVATAEQPEVASLPESPGARISQHGHRSAGQVPCQASTQIPISDPEAMSAQEVRSPCLSMRNPYRRFLDSTQPTPMTTRQKGLLAIHDVTDPFNLLTIGGNAAFTIGINSHTAFGPGFRGFGELMGVSFLQDATGEFIGTYAVCSLAHQDPRYHRDPESSAAQRVLHAMAHTVVAQHDDGSPMLNYENLITYSASAEISNLYVPGIHGNGPSTVERILTGLATDPVNNLITEFLPDFAKRVHIRIVFVQQLLNNLASGQQL